MKKAINAIFMATFLVFINCKNNAGEEVTADNNDATTKFYQSLVELEHGFLDVFNSFGGLVAEIFGDLKEIQKNQT
ncbi:hypothetical protein [Borreliella americana]|uniref:hypothetical protein n=1 Tax=Borreliella americana TaxID=478807 RepID=UPI001E341CFC|nr:hypothetical protein [Borreliella americana]MCD2332686.1 hypothetical protein [Borreliella americana]MCD2382088.1 hypothetical protein [Borreliella americana]